MKKKNLFLSYCWNDSSKADKIYDYFKRNQNIELHRDKIDIKKWGSIKEYMQSINNMDYTILLISDSYLKSPNCMYEVLEVMRDRNYEDKIFPAVIDSGIYSPVTKAKYVKHWQDEFKELESTLKEINVQNLGKLNEDLKRRQDISSNIAEFLDVVSNKNNPDIADVCIDIEKNLSEKGFLGNNQIRDENDLMEDIDHMKENMNGLEGGRGGNSGEIPIRNRADEYAQRWNKNVFLNNFNEEDENAGINIKLREIYVEECLPHYERKLDDEGPFVKSSTDLKGLLREYTIDNDGKKMLIILGQPGIGKSTLITWIMANLVENKENILVYQFASDLGNINWQGNNILDEILATINLGYNELDGKSLILDGFDEIYVKEDRGRILHKMNQELKKKNYLKTFSIIITCRENYVDESDLRNIEYITLKAWNEEQIKSFCEVYEKENAKKGSKAIDNINLEAKINGILNNEEIFGIPLFLYMVLALNIHIGENSSIVDIYDQVFSLERGGIYDRGCDAEHRINEPKIIKHIHLISQRIAFWMFENSADKAIISQEKFEELCEDVMKESGKKEEDLQRDALIENFFQIKHCEGKGTGELQFVHHTIYEYFVTVYFFESIHDLNSEEEVAGKLGGLLKYGKLSKQILRYIKYKFDSMKGYDLSEITREIFNIMLRDGMTYHFIKEQKSSLLNIIDREMNVSFNMIEIVGLWNESLGRIDNKIITYLLCNREDDFYFGGFHYDGVTLVGEYLSEADLSGADLHGANLSRVYISGANLSGADLHGANLSEANLNVANLSGANLNGAYLSGAELSGANLYGANLYAASLIGAQLNGAYLSEAELNGANLYVANLREANLHRANLSRADLIGAKLFEAKLIGAELNGANLATAKLNRAKLNGAYLNEAYLIEADLSEADLSRANLSGANLSGANLSRANLSGANLFQTIFDEKQIYLLCEKYDLTNSKVYIFKTVEIISYEEYCHKNNV